MRTRIILATILAASAAVAVAAVAPAHGASGGTPRCTHADLAVWVGVGGGEAAAGHLYYPLEFSNISGHTCHLLGYPGVSAYNRHQVGRAAGRTGATPPTVTLAPRQSGHTTLALTNVGVFDPAVCKPTTAAELHVYPPGARDFIEVPFEVGACRSRAVTYMEVDPVQPRVGIPGF